MVKKIISIGLISLLLVGIFGAVICAQKTEERPVAPETTPGKETEIPTEKSESEAIIEITAHELLKQGLSKSLGRYVVPVGEEMDLKEGMVIRVTGLVEEIWPQFYDYPDLLNPEVKYIQLGPSLYGYHIYCYFEPELGKELKEIVKEKKLEPGDTIVVKGVLGENILKVYRCKLIEKR